MTNLLFRYAIQRHSPKFNNAKSDNYRKAPLGDILKAKINCDIVSAQAILGVVGWYFHTIEAVCAGACHIPGDVYMPTGVQILFLKFLAATIT